jgi:pyruvate/2-oxoglutarate dehydrogenase complex dihydrolipoamide dehydrogenase (E3) component
LTLAVSDGRKFGFCKLVADRKGGHIIGERAVDIAEVAAIAIATGMRVVRNSVRISRRTSRAPPYRSTTPEWQPRSS